MFPLKFLHQVRLDVAEVYSWYEEQRTGLGADWLLCLEETLERISRNPELFVRVRKHIRCAMLHRFPYNVFFQIDEKSVLIYGVFHTSRDSRHWQSRI